jgi:hypothetical protein
MNRPTETGVDMEPISQRLRERQTRQWAETWGKELDEVDAEWDELEDEYTRAANAVMEMVKQDARKEKAP